MLDFTPQVTLPPKWQKRYKIARFWLVLIFLVAIIWLTCLALFPAHHFIFFFENPLASKNTLIEPRNPQGELFRKGKVSQDKNVMIFDAPLSFQEGDFSEIEIEFILENDSSFPASASASVKKSFRAFFYPEGESIMNLSKFQSASGALFSYGGAVYIIDHNQYRPIADEATFVSMGFQWQDVKPASLEDLESFEKGKLFTLANPHPDGTIFFDESSGNYFLIEKKQKRRIINKDKISDEAKTSPIKADHLSLENDLRCSLIQKSFPWKKSLFCRIPISDLLVYPGNNFQFEINFKIRDSIIEIKEARVIFKKEINRQNWKLALAKIKKNIVLNYYGKNQ